MLIETLESRELMSVTPVTPTAPSPLPIPYPIVDADADADAAAKKKPATKPTLSAISFTHVYDKASPVL